MGVAIISEDIHNESRPCGAVADLGWDEFVDTDGDGMPDWWEVLTGLHPNDPSDADLDSDGDGWTNLEEYTASTDPSLPSSHP